MQDKIKELVEYQNKNNDLSNNGEEREVNFQTEPQHIFPKIIYISATFLTAFLFVYKFKVPKFKGLFYAIVPILALILVVLLLEYLLYY